MPACELFFIFLILIFFSNIFQSINNLNNSPGVWGHFAGGGLNLTDTKFIDDELKELLNK
jgi:hypothetical protein